MELRQQRQHIGGEIVGRRANATAEHDVVSGKGAPERGSDEG